MCPCTMWNAQSSQFGLLARWLNWYKEEMYAQRRFLKTDRLSERVNNQKHTHINRSWHGKAWYVAVYMCMRTAVDLHGLLLLLPL